MLGVMCFETTSCRVCGVGLTSGAAGSGAFCGSFCGAATLSLRSWDICWPDRMSGSGTLPVSRVCDTVVMLARSGRRYVGAIADLDSKRALRADRASRAIVVCRAIGYSTTFPRVAEFD